jgi:Domain of unknown function (DUF4167)
LINNRQAGRRRGRGGQQRQQGGSPGRGPESGNRIDNRARGNAAQLLEKYKNLARDAQMQGDRVNLEYYLQFADHYFRVLADTRARQEEANPGRTQQPRERNAGDDFDEDFEGDAEATAEADRRESMNDRVDGQDYRGNSNGNGNGNGYDRQRDDRPRQDRNNQDRQRNDRPQQDRMGQDRQDRPQRDPRPVEAAPQAAAPRTEDEPRAPRRGRPPRIEQTEDDRLPATMLPPSIQMGVEGEPASDDEMPPAPKRRGRPRKIVPDAEAAAE